MQGFHLQLSAVFGLATIGYGQSHQPNIHAGYPYCPAVVSTNDGIHHELRVFPLSGKAFTIPVRTLSGAVFSPDGRALYGACTPYRDQEKDGDPIRIAICKVDLYTGATTTVPSTVQDLVRCGPKIALQIDRVPALTFPDGNPTFISLPADGQPWRDLSLSPDGERAVATHNRQLRLIDVVRGTAKPLVDEVFIAAWSPDGKWLAYVENRENGRTILMDAATLSPQHVLGNSELDWSPDSHYLLGMKRSDRCGFQEAGTLEAIDVPSGKRTTIESSKCQVDRATTGWVRCDISRR